jgi:hypothetical protein
MQLGGAWQEALDEIRQVSERHGDRADPDAFGDAWYPRGELHRLRGEFAEAEDAYRLASESGPATVSAFALDLYEVTVGRFRAFVDVYPGSRPTVGAGINGERIDSVRA